MGKSLLLGCVSTFWLGGYLLLFRFDVRGWTVILVNIVEIVELQDRPMFQFKHLTEPTTRDGIEDGNLGRTTGRGCILRERVVRREDDINPDTALGSIAVVFEFQPVSMQALLGIGVISGGRGERGKSKARSFEIYKRLKSGCRLGSLVELFNIGE